MGEGSGSSIVGRVIALGASNLTRGLPAVVSTARDRWGRAVEILAALGLGRSYGSESRVGVRTLPGILQSGLWRQLEALDPAPTRGLITDVGNDILYGASPSDIVAWVEECVARLRPHTSDIVLTDLPLVSVRRLSRPKFLFFRTVLFPRCRLSLGQVVERTVEVTAGLETLAATRGLRFFRLKPDWYGVDPIHFRPGMWGAAWTEILGGDDDGGPPSLGSDWRDTIRLYTLPPERQWLVGMERVTPQSGVALAAGGRVWLY